MTTSHNIMIISHDNVCYGLDRKVFNVMDRQNSSMTETIIWETWAAIEMFPSIISKHCCKSTSTE